MDKNKLLLMSLLLLLTSCAAVPIESNFEGICFELKKEFHLFNGRGNGYRGDYMIVVNPQSQIVREMKKIGVLVSGTQLSVNQIFKASDGSTGAFITVQTEILDGPYKGTLTDIPNAYAPYHPGRKGIIIERLSIKKNIIKFNDSLVKGCTEPEKL